MSVLSPSHLCSLAAVLMLTLGATATAATAATAQNSAADLREVMFVGNNWEGTADVIKSTGDFAKVGRVNGIPDKAERLAAINADPIKWAYFLPHPQRMGQGPGDRVPGQGVRKPVRSTRTPSRRARNFTMFTTWAAVSEGVNTPDS